MYTHLNLTNRLTIYGLTPAENHKLDLPLFRKSKLYHYDYDSDNQPVEPTKVRRLTDYLTYQKKVLTGTSYKSYSGFANKWKACAKGADLLSLPTKELTSAIGQEFVDYLVTLPIDNTTHNNQITVGIRCH